jgi:3-oxoacyl-[acyl-carrier protein] reductase
VILPNATVIVTGGASGIGLAFARRLTARGARVWVIDRDRAAIDSARAAADEGARERWLVGDVGDEQQVVALVEQIEQASGGIDALVNNAAVLLDQALVSRLGRRVKKHALADWEETLRSNLTGTFLMAREAADAMIRGRRRGVIVNISSISAHGNPGQTAYAASKAAIDALTVTWSQELAVYGIRVAGIAPGFVETPMTRRIPPMFLESIRTRTPIKRFGTFDEFENAIQFVLENDYFNGKVLQLDGGLRF